MVEHIARICTGWVGDLIKIIVTYLERDESVPSTKLFETVEIPEPLDNAQLISVQVAGVETCFIFGSDENENIYKYNNKTNSYDIYDKYKLNIISCYK